MRARCLLTLLIATIHLCGCGGTTLVPSSGSTSSATISFSGLGGLPCFGLMFPPSPSCAVRSYSENGYIVTVNSGNWSARIDYGSPPPFIQFWATSGTTVSGEIVITAASASAFYFRSVDLYSSTTPIPYTIRGGTRTDVFAETDTLPNTFGDFRTVVSQHSADAIDHLSITLTNAAASCPTCANPMGLDSIVLSSAPTPAPPPTMFSLGGQVTDSATGAGVSGALLSIVDGPNAHLSATTDASGTYRFADLQQSGFTLAASAPNYIAQSKGVTLTSNQTLSFQLVRLPPPPPGTTIVGFSGLTVNGAAVTSYTESGFTVLAAAGAWVAVVSRAPYIEFSAPASTTVNGEVRVSAVDGSVFSFKAVDLYSSTTGIPYKITGLRNAAPVFTVSDTLPNPFGNFKTVTNPNATTAVDTVSIILTNAASGVSNPMGLTNIVLAR